MALIGPRAEINPLGAGKRPKSQETGISGLREPYEMGLRSTRGMIEKSRTGQTPDGHLPVIRLPGGIIITPKEEEDSESDN